MKTIGDVLEREMRPQESDEPELGRCESVVLSPPDPRLETLQPGRQRSGIGISLEYVAGDLRVFEGAGNVAEVEADVGAAQREIGVEPWARAEQWAEPANVLQLACGLRLVTALVVRQRSCRVGDGAVDRVVEVLLGDKPARFDRPSLRVSPIAQLV